MRKSCAIDPPGSSSRVSGFKKSSKIIEQLFSGDGMSSSASEIQTPPARGIRFTDDAFTVELSDDWPDLDEDISVEGLLLGRRSGESQESFRKWLQSRSSIVPSGGGE